MFLLTGILCQVVGLLTGNGTPGIAQQGPTRVKPADIINNPVEFVPLVLVQHKILVGSGIIDIQELAIRFREARFPKRGQRVDILRLVRQQCT